MLILVLDDSTRGKGAEKWPDFRTPNSSLIVYIIIIYVYTNDGETMAVAMTTIRLDTRLADEAVKVLGAKSRTDAVHIALREIVALKRFKALMKKNSGKLKFSGLDE